ncbi:MAG TPA: type II toxin-antitoxin system RelE/ParE family toxin [Phycisphaerae bacterium]|nr:type II toxin-antitoxin system RelE/ParE family toxin [Phycisphaerae bacterium]HDZ43623.1 type II toxin-antitoxin system RelE/ParE family toxin [Phycisphaerae bacterium]
MRYAVEFRPTAARDLRELDAPGRCRVLAAVELLRDNPHPLRAELQEGQWRPYLRVRTGGYRILYYVRDERRCLCIVHVGGRHTGGRPQTDAAGEGGDG